jgi:hypothetical protein
MGDAKGEQTRNATKITSSHDAEDASLSVLEHVVDGRKWWRLPDPSLVPSVCVVSTSEMRRQ